MEVKCPRCGKPTVFSPENPCRPFCSDRCKLIDLGQWAEGKYAIPTETPGHSGSTPLVESDDYDEDEDASDSGHAGGFPVNRH
jgi:endogenous inhibitor of DNA gyrase (YacG/DUF329 family)